MKKIILCSLIALAAIISSSCSSTADKKEDGPRPYEAVVAPAEAPATAESTPPPSMENSMRNSMKNSMQKTTKEKIASCTCVKIWMPVCGENKKTYGNSCEADCAGVKYTAGACEKMK